MAQLDEYIKDAETHNLGQDAIQEAKKQAKKQAKKPVKKLASKAKHKFLDVTGLGALKSRIKNRAGKLAKAGAKKVLHAGASALKAALAFLLSNPVGWVILAVLLAAGIALHDKLEEDARMEEVTSALVEAGASGPSGELTEDGVAVLLGDCPEAKEAVAGDIDMDASMEANACALYSVFKGYGLNDESISGILGNLQAEAGVDPTTIEGIYNEPHQVGPRKQAAFADLGSYTSGTVFSLYASSGVSINKNAYKASDGNYYCGIGMVQWTGPGAYQMLSVGASTGHAWYSLEYQLAYMVSDAHYRPGFFAQWKANPSTSPEEAAAYFAEHYEGNTKLAQAERKENAAAWFAKMPSWNVDEAYYQSVLGLSGSMGGTASDTAVGEQADACPDTGAFDNNSIASSAVSYAYATQAEGNGNNGTALYQRVHDNIYPGDAYYMACDRSVACAVRWSGSDDTYPQGSTGDQYTYLLSSPKWQSIGMSGSLTIEQLQPGDVFILVGHTFLYTGKEAIQSFHKGKAAPDADSVSGSLNERSPGCGNDTSSILARGGEDWTGRGQYEVFRCVNPDRSKTYQHAGSSAGLE